MKYKYLYSTLDVGSDCRICKKPEISPINYSTVLRRSRTYPAICGYCIERLEDTDPDWACGLEANKEGN